MNDIPSSPELFDEFNLPSAQGRKSAPVNVAVVRELTLADLEALVTESPQAPQTHNSIVKVRYAHHSIARQLAMGTRPMEVSRITGYSPSYISTIQNDPAFQELIEHYKAQAEQKFVDTVERANSLGIQAMEELQERLTTDPDSFKHRELMEVAQLGLGLGDAAKKNASQNTPGGAPMIQISFVTPEALPPTAPRMIDISPEDD